MLQPLKKKYQSLDERYLGRKEKQLKKFIIRKRKKRRRNRRMAGIF